MIDRYYEKDITTIWSDTHKYQIWFELERLHYNTLMKKNVKLRLLQPDDIIEIKKIEKNTKHDLASLVDCIEQNKLFGDDEDTKYVHYALTSSDIVDTALNIMLKMSNKVITKEINLLIDEICESDLQGHTIVGKTHGQPVEPLPLNKLLEDWSNRLTSYATQLEQVELYCKVGGVIGNKWTEIKSVLENTAYRWSKQFGLTIHKHTSQIIPREDMLDSFHVLFKIASLINKIALDYRLMHRDGNVVKTEQDGYKGSSSIPTKSNPTDLEKINGLFSVIKGLYHTLLDNTAQFDSRDISNSSIERITIPDFYGYLVHMIKTLKNAVKKYTASHHINTHAHMYMYKGSSAMLNILIKYGNVKSRKEAYEIIKQCYGCTEYEWYKEHGILMKSMLYYYYTNKNVNVALFNKFVDDLVYKAHIPVKKAIDIIAGISGMNEISIQSYVDNLIKYSTKL